ncbi:caleosin family protein [Rhodotorula paludigena]|uniref:caleosin family protein n=1 Tax=Rhodotorula paludigena TaxID=86838 RepID=UPI003176FE6F
MATYADKATAWIPDEQMPKPNPAFLDSLQPANRKDNTTALSPPLTPPSERDDSDLLHEKAPEGVRQRPSNKGKAAKGGNSTEQAGHHKDDKRKVPGEGFVQSIPGTVSAQRYVPEDLDQRLARPWVPRANIAATPEHPYGTTVGGWADKHKDEPVLAQHVAFFDKDRDNILWPLDTWRGFREMGYSFFWCTFAMSVIHFFFSWFTAPGFLPDPFWRVFLKNGHRSKHGSDTGVYDSEGRFIPAKFEEIFSKFDKGNKGGLTFWEGVHMIHAQRQAVDPIGWCAEAFEWASTYLLIWPKDGICDKESIRTVYDGSIFFVVAAEERKRNAARLERRKQMSLPAALWDRVPHPWRGWNKENKAGSFEWTEDKFQQ